VEAERRQRELDEARAAAEAEAAAREERTQRLAALEAERQQVRCVLREREAAQGKAAAVAGRPRRLCKEGRGAGSAPLALLR
jgi:hypothetical protein